MGFTIVGFTTFGLNVGVGLDVGVGVGDGLDVCVGDGIGFLLSTGFDIIANVWELLFNRLIMEIPKKEK